MGEEGEEGGVRGERREGEREGEQTAGDVTLSSTVVEPSPQSVSDSLPELSSTSQCQPPLSLNVAGQLSSSGATIPPPAADINPLPLTRQLSGNPQIK